MPGVASNICQWDIDSLVHPDPGKEPGLFHIMNPDFDKEIFDIWLTSNFMADLSIHERHDRMSREHFERERKRQKISKD